MARTVRVPEPVYEEIDEIAEQEDISQGAVVRDWWQKAQKYDQREAQE